MPRLEIADADLSNIVLTGSEHWNGGLLLPAGNGRFRDFVQQHRDQGEPFDVIILDSMSTHLQNPFFGFRANRMALQAMTEVAKKFNLAIVLLHHFNKDKGSTVESAIGGQGVLQNLSKAIFVWGRWPSDKSETMVLACERLGYGRPPTSIQFCQVDGAHPRVEPDGAVDVTAWDVYEVSRAKDSGSGRSKVDDAAAWVVDFFAEVDYQPQPARVVMEKAQTAERYFSKNTFDRALSKIAIERISPTEAEQQVEGYLFASDADRRGWWWKSPIVRPMPVDAVVDDEVPTPQMGTDTPQVADGE